MKVYFIGAGPGDPELLTLKARRIIETADVLIYADSLVNPEILKWAKDSAVLFNSATMTRQEIARVLSWARSEDKTVARLHSGDTALFSAVQEQLDWCRENSIDFEVVPGVSSLSAASAALKQELTLPGVSQTVILSRLGDRTPVPEREGLRELAKIGATLVLFLSAHLVEEVVAQVREFYSPDTPVAVVERASWPEERQVRGTLANIADKVKEAGINSTAIIIIGHVLGTDYQKSRLYDPEFGHTYRQGR